VLFKVVPVNGAVVVVKGPIIVFFRVTKCVFDAGRILIVIGKGDWFTFWKFRVPFIVFNFRRRGLTLFNIFRHHCHNVFLNGSHGALKFSVERGANNFIVLDRSAIHEVLIYSDFTFFERIDLVTNLQGHNSGWSILLYAFNVCWMCSESRRERDAVVAMTNR